MDLNITPAARAKIFELTRNKPHHYLRVALEPGGCSGTYYRFEIAVAEAEDVRDDTLRLALTPAAATARRTSRLQREAATRPVPSFKEPEYTDQVPV